jgi:hypothetical protein
MLVLERPPTGCPIIQADGFAARSTQALGVMSSETTRLPTTEARVSLATRFDLPYRDDMQDWEWEVADESRFQEFLSAYESSDLSAAERFSLMEVLVQCVENKTDEAAFLGAWRAIERHLAHGGGLHLSTIQYWASVGESDISHCFRVAPAMRRLLKISTIPNPPRGE